MPPHPSSAPHCDTSQPRVFVVNKIINSYIAQILPLLPENALDSVQPAVRRIVSNICVPSMIINIGHSQVFFFGRLNDKPANKYL